MHPSLVFRLLGVTTTLGLTSSFVLAAEPSSKPETAPAASQPASQPAALDPVVERILDRLEQKGERIKDIRAKLRYVKKDMVLESEQVFEGLLRFRHEEPNPRFLILFEKSSNDGVASNKKEWHVFDGEKYIEARESTKTIVKHQIVEPGKKVEVFRLGEGPFPLPFGQKKADILKHFTVRLIPPAKDDPANTDHLECTPLSGTELSRKYAKVHFYIDRILELPVKVRTVENGDENEIIAVFSEPKLNTGMPASDLNLPNLESEGYQEVSSEK